MTTVRQLSFSGGEIAPALYGRVDQVKYQTGLRSLRNMFVMRHGGATSRPGTSFIGEVKDSTKTIKMIPFIFNSDQTYVLEFGNQYMRVIRQGAYVTNLDLTITNITNASPAVLSYTGTDPANGDQFYISGVVGGMDNFVNDRVFVVANVNAGANTFELKYLNGTNVNSAAFGSYTSGGVASRIFTLTTPYVEADLPALQVVESADIIIIAHPSYAPRELSRTGHATWTLSSITFEPSIAAPGSVINSGGVGVTTSWVVTTVKQETFEESLQSTATTSSSTPTSGAPVTVSWAAVSGAQEYNVYRAVNGIYGFVGVAAGVSFIDVGNAPDTSDTPPITRNPFGSTDNYPSTVTFIQQRLAFANTNNNPETVYLSKTGMFYNFTIRSPVQDDDAVTFTMAGRQVNSVKHLLDLGALLAFTTGSEYIVQGDSAGIIRPGEINPKQQSSNGSGDLPPLILGGNAIYLQARGGVIRDLAFEFATDSYRGNELSIFSAHLFEGHTIVDWAYQQIPHSVVWAVRDDGVLLGFTYVREHQLWAWHRHDFDGEVENVCVIPEGEEDFLYVCVKRTVNNATVRYIERMNTRVISDIEDYIGMDAADTYDGTNTGSTTMTLSGAGWTFTDTLTLTASAAFFTSEDVGNAIHITGSDGTIIRFTIDAFSSTTVVTGRPHATVPVTMRATAILTWAKAVMVVNDLWHLEGKEVSIFGDGFVVASPNNVTYDVVTVTNGAVTLERPYSVIHVGIPFLSDLETLDIDTAQGETLVDKKKNISRITANVEASRGMWAGPKPPTDDDDDPLEGLYELKIRQSEGYNEPVDLLTGSADINIRSEWNSNGRIFLRQVDPLPLTILSIAPAGLLPFKG